MGVVRIRICDDFFSDAHLYMESFYLWENQTTEQKKLSNFTITTITTTTTTTTENTVTGMLLQIFQLLVQT